MKVLVTAGAGHQGKLLIAKLAATGHFVRAARLSSGRDDELKALGAHEVFVGDLARLDQYTEALRGCDAVYHVGPTASDGEVQSGLAMIEAAQRCGTRHVVFSSVYHTIIDIVQHRYKRDIEEKLFESGLNCTVLRPCDYMMPEYHVDIPLHTGTLPVFWKINPNRRGSLIAMEDLTDVAAKVLIEGDKHFFADYELAGPDKLNSHEIGRIASRVLGRNIAVMQSSVPEFMEARYGVREPTRVTEHAFEVFNSIANWYSRFSFIGNPNVLEWLLGRPATSLEQFIRRELQKRGQGSERPG